MHSICLMCSTKHDILSSSTLVDSYDGATGNHDHSDLNMCPQKIMLVAHDSVHTLCHLWATKMPVSSDREMENIFERKVLFTYRWITHSYIRIAKQVYFLLQSKPIVLSAEFVCCAHTHSINIFVHICFVITLIPMRFRVWESMRSWTKNFQVLDQMFVVACHPGIFFALLSCETSHRTKSANDKLRLFIHT